MITKKPVHSSGLSIWPSNRMATNAASSGSTSVTTDVRVMQPGDVFVIETPGGGGFGSEEAGPAEADQAEGEQGTGQQGTGQQGRGQQGRGEPK